MIRSGHRAIQGSRMQKNRIEWSRERAGSVLQGTVKSSRLRPARGMASAMEVDRGGGSWESRAGDQTLDRHRRASWGRKIMPGSLPEGQFFFRPPAFFLRVLGPEW